MTADCKFIYSNIYIGFICTWYLHRKLELVCPWYFISAASFGGGRLMDMNSRVGMPSSRRGGEE